jgi:hypothetical protein
MQGAHGYHSHSTGSTKTDLKPGMLVWHCTQQRMQRVIHRTDAAHARPYGMRA